MPLIGFLSLLLLSSTLYANELLEMDFERFYQQPQYQQQYQQMLDSGQLDKARQQFSKPCVQEAKTASDQAYCACMAQQIAQVDGRELFYESVLGYQFFLAKFEVDRLGDTNQYKLLEQRQKQTLKLEKVIESACGKN